MKYLMKILGCKTDRTGYFLSVLAVVIGFYYYFFHLNLSDTCYVCKPPELFPWIEILTLFVTASLGGGYFCILFCWASFETSWVGASVIFPILLTAFFYVQTIRRCHDVGWSGWKSLIPVYSPLFLFFIVSKSETEEQIGKSSMVTLLWEKMLLILFMIIICILYYTERASFVHLHHEIY